MDFEIQQLLNDVNRAIIKFRGVYSAWSKKHGVSYNEMLVLYTIRDNGFCTQKQICDSYLLPKQTVNNVISSMLGAGLLCDSPEYTNGREKAFIFSDKGKAYAAPLLASLGEVEETAVEAMGIRKLRQMTALICEYDAVLTKALEEDRV
jgi:DNA-binding MarR family transcriptional regulator